jgi:hypothetical protein
VHFKEFLRNYTEYVCNQRGIGPFGRNVCNNNTGCLVKKVTPGSGTIIPDLDSTWPKVPDPTESGSTTQPQAFNRTVTETPNFYQCFGSNPGPGF